MVGYALHLAGDQTAAKAYLSRMVESYEVPIVGGRIIRFVFDQRERLRPFLGRILWLQGQADRAVELNGGGRPCDPEKR